MRRVGDPFPAIHQGIGLAVLLDRDPATRGDVQLRRAEDRTPVADLTCIFALVSIRRAGEGQRAGLIFVQYRIRYGDRADEYGQQSGGLYGCRR